MQLPTIHLNGTSKQSLIDGLCEASGAIGLAYASLKQTAPNGRDYYPQGPAALEAAIAEHNGRLLRLDAVMDEVDELIRAIDAIR